MRTTNTDEKKNSNTVLSKTRGVLDDRCFLKEWDGDAVEHNETLRVIGLSSPPNHGRHGSDMT